MAKNNLILSGSVKNPVCMAVPCVFVPACLKAGEETCVQAATETTTIPAGSLHWEQIETFQIYLYTQM